MTEDVAYSVTVEHGLRTLSVFVEAPSPLIAEVEACNQYQWLFGHWPEVIKVEEAFA